ncbi:glycosyl transferase family 1 [Candidatus Gracilibacteria bacterium]|nr:MAG: glycosyl transferase family 1 [Candidatus Gracilibacteria bacterium]
MTKKIAIIHDWLVDFGGAESVLLDIMELYPEADVFTSVNHIEHPKFEGKKIRTTWIEKIPFLSRRHKLSGFLRHFAFRGLDLHEYDILISSSSAEAKHIKKLPHQTHISYCHCITRYYWGRFDEYQNMMEFGWLNPIAKIFLKLLISKFRKWDFEAAQNVDIFIANSRYTQKGIKKFYKKDSLLISPSIPLPIKENPVETRENYYFAIGRCVPYKRFDLLVDAFNTNGKNIIIATNTDTELYRELKEKSNKNIVWKFNPSRQEISSYFSNAKGFLFPQEEDFGIVAIEALATGTPIIAYKKGGSQEIVQENENGIFFEEATQKSINNGIEKFEKKKWNYAKIAWGAKKYEKENFVKKFRKVIEN